MYNFEQTPEDGAAARNSEPAAKKTENTKFIAYKLFRGEPVNICVYVATKDRKKFSAAQLAAETKSALDAWTAGAAEMIKQAGREDEFSDFINDAAARKINIKECSVGQKGEEKSVGRDFVTNINPDGGNYDLVVLIDSKKCRSGGGVSFTSQEPFNHVCLNGEEGSKIASYSWKDKKILKYYIENKGKTPFGMKVPFFEGWSITLSHETGHAIGLADQYKEGLWNADLYYASLKPRESLMSCDSSVLTCDDLDGIITLDDRVNKRERTFDSLCRDGSAFKNGKPVIFKTVIKPALVPGEKKAKWATVITPEQMEKGEGTFNDRWYSSIRKYKKELAKQGFDVSFFDKNEGGVVTEEYKDTELDADGRRRIYVFTLALQSENKIQEVIVREIGNFGKVFSISAPRNFIVNPDGSRTEVNPRVPKNAAGTAGTVGLIGKIKAEAKALGLSR